MILHFLLLQDVVTSFVFMACMFAGWVPNAVHSGDVKDEREDCEALTQPVGDRCDQLKDVESAMAATAVSHLWVAVKSTTGFTFIGFWSIWDAVIYCTGSVHDVVHIG